MATLNAVTQEKTRRAVEALSRRGQPVAVYLFGSHAEGRADKWSDYDLAVFLDGVENWDVVRVAQFCASIQKEAGDDIELHVFPATQATAPDPASFAAYIIAHGVRLPLNTNAA